MNFVSIKKPYLVIRKNNLGQISQSFVYHFLDSNAGLYIPSFIPANESFYRIIFNGTCLFLDHKCNKKMPYLLACWLLFIYHLFFSSSSSFFVWLPAVTQFFYLILVALLRFLFKNWLSLYINIFLFFFIFYYY